jgi:hypothetical protein
MEIKLVEHKIKETTPWGVVEKSLNQHIVLLKNEDSGQFVQCGYVGDTAFLPLSGFPQEACEQVAKLCEDQLGKPVSAGFAPPGIEELAAYLSKEDDDE